jgi:hypothetical protein
MAPLLLPTRPVRSAGGACGYFLFTLRDGKIAENDLRHHVTGSVLQR